MFDQFVEGMSLRGESLLAFQQAYPQLTLAIIVIGFGSILGLLVWALLKSNGKTEREK